jgi:hypothetical protein
MRLSTRASLRAQVAGPFASVAAAIQPHLFEASIFSAYLRERSIAISNVLWLKQNDRERGGDGQENLGAFSRQRRL